MQQLLSGVREARKRTRPFWAAAHFPARFVWCTRARYAIRRFRAGEFRRLRAAGTGRTRGGRKKGGTPTVSLPL